MEPHRLDAGLVVLFSQMSPQVGDAVMARAEIF
jgi:hypothetical protein